MIRPATESDIDTMIELGRQMHAESWYAHTMPFDPSVLRQTLQKVLHIGFAYLHEHTGIVDGVMIGMLCPSWFGPGYFAADLAVFVTSNKRGGMAAYRLVETFIDWAGKQGALEVNLGISTGVQPEVLGLLYERIGFTRVGGVYKMKMEARCGA